MEITFTTKLCKYHNSDKNNFDTYKTGQTGFKLHVCNENQFFRSARWPRSPFLQPRSCSRALGQNHHQGTNQTETTCKRLYIRCQETCFLLEKKKKKGFWTVPVMECMIKVKAGRVLLSRQSGRIIFLYVHLSEEAWKMEDNLAYHHFSYIL